MELDKIKNLYINNKLNKVEYIQRMHEVHSTLFDYSDFIKNKDIKKIEISDEGVIMTSRDWGVKIQCDAVDHRIVPLEILNFDYYEKENSSMIFNLVKDNSVVFDIGSNIGWYSLGLSKTRQKLQVFAFEPIPKTFNYLKKNIELNQLDNIQAYNHGLSNQNAEIQFYYYPEGSGNSSLADLAEDHNSVKINSTVKKLDDFVDENAIDRIDFIKCDVEGAELMVFQGGEKSIRHFKPIIFTEMLRKWASKFEYHPNEIIDFFKQLDYKCFTVIDDRLVEFIKMDEQSTETNFFFLHNMKHAAEIKNFC